MKNFIKYLFYILLVISVSCNKQDNKINAVARVYNNYLYQEDLLGKIPENLSKEDSILYRNNIIKTWATEQILLQKAKINIEDANNEIKNLVETYKKELLIDKYKRAVLQQELDTVLTEIDIDEYYNSNKNIYKLNEDLIQLKYIHFNKDLIDKKEIIKLFRSNENDDVIALEERELEFYSFNFNDSIWVSIKSVEKKLPFLKKENKLKNNQFIQKEDSLGVYLLAVKDILHRNQVAPKSYLIPTIRQMILHKRKLELMNTIEKTIMIDAIKNKQFEQY
jgi:hypothetical protein